MPFNFGGPRNKELKGLAAIGLAKGLTEGLLQARQLHMEGERHKASLAQGEASRLSSLANVGATFRQSPTTGAIEVSGIDKPPRMLQAETANLLAKQKAEHMKRSEAMQRTALKFQQGRLDRSEYDSLANRLKRLEDPEHMMLMSAFAERSGDQSVVQGINEEADRIRSVMSLYEKKLLEKTKIHLPGAPAPEATPQRANPVDDAMQRLMKKYPIK